MRREGRRVCQWKIEKAAAIEVKAADLGQQISRYREAIARKEEEAIEQGRELYTLLVEPIQPALAKKTRVVVVPDAFLWSLPFESLPNAAGRFLVEDVAIGTRRRSPPWRRWTPHRPRAAAPPSLVAFGQPLLGKAAEERLALVRPPAPGRRRRRRRTARFQNVAAVFGPRGPRPTSGDVARADTLAAGVAPGLIIHLAVPLVLAEAAPLYSLAGIHAHRSRPTPASGLIEAASLMSWAPAGGSCRGLPRRVRADIGRGRRAHRAGLVASSSGARRRSWSIAGWPRATGPQRRRPVSPRARTPRRRPPPTASAAPHAGVGVPAESDEGDPRPGRPRGVRTCWAGYLAIGR